MKKYYLLIISFLILSCKEEVKNKNIVYAFGHHHLGWTLGAITGKIISGIVAEEKTNLDLSPYSSKRFN